MLTFAIEFTNICTILSKSKTKKPMLSSYSAFYQTKLSQTYYSVSEVLCLGSRKLNSRAQLPLPLSILISQYLRRNTKYTVSIHTNRRKECANESIRSFGRRGHITYMIHNSSDQKDPRENWNNFHRTSL